MKYLNPIFFILLPLVLGASTYQIRQESESSMKFNVTIEQNGVQKIIKNSEVALKPETFDIVFEFSEPMSVLVNASFNNKTFKLASKNAHLDKLPGFIELGMAEGLNNSEKNLFIDDESPNFWFYDNDEFNRFNSIEKRGDKIICKRTIESLYVTESKTTIKMKDIKTPVYLVFVSYINGEKSEERIEVQRQYLKIKWVE
jgi:hypothetical protein